MQTKLFEVITPNTTINKKTLQKEYKEKYPDIKIQIRETNDNITIKIRGIATKYLKSFEEWDNESKVIALKYNDYEEYDRLQNLFMTQLTSQNICNDIWNEIVEIAGENTVTVNNDCEVYD